MIDVEIVPAPIAAGDPGLGRDPLSPVVATDVPAELHVWLAVHVLDSRTDVAEELAGRLLLDRKETEAVSLVGLPVSGDPRDDPIAVERCRVPPHGLGVSEDREQRFEIVFLERPQPEWAGGELHRHLDRR